ncbi:NAD(P)/FAD-dependent oxidoreductase [Tropicimonas sp. IMCC34011]|uniref:dihydrolipoyl dehydrogenase family protein n=1 Tax=Tropicimonas sp. IMCC34011 TaxID=2248759 RepID=UPI000E227711|nr:FAD-dependent oxidoreductase [Tropicimonas sp. IMCC34011]
MRTMEADICVIGAGSGGLTVASGAAQMGAKVVLIEANEMGGDCLNFGCVPSKALIAAARHAHAMRSGGIYGIAPVEPQVDFAAVHDHIHGVIAAIAPVDSQERFEGMGCTVIRAHARFVSDREVEAGDTRIRARRIVLATGSRPAVPPVEGLTDGPYLTNETLFDLKELPEHLLIIGGGNIGCEMAQAFRRLGARVTVIEGGTPLAKDDPENAALLLETMKGEGVTFVTGHHADKVEWTEGGVTVRTEAGTYSGSHLLVAAGRAPALDDLGLEAAGIERDKKGLKVDDTLQTTNRRVYAVGDAAGGMQFTHLAGYHGSTLIRRLLFGLPAKVKTAHIPWATYTSPELAQCGLTEKEAREAHGDAVEVVTSTYSENDRAEAERRTEGRIKVMVVGGRPVGASIVGESAGDLITLWSLAISAKLKMSQISGMVAPYPTLSELNKRAAGAYFSPRLFDNPNVKRVVRAVQRILP